MKNSGIVAIALIYPVFVCAAASLAWAQDAVPRVEITPLAAADAPPLPAGTAQPAPGRPVSAQSVATDAPREPTTLFTRGTRFGGYGGPSVAYSRIAGEDGALVGVEGALLIDHRLAIGGAGYIWAGGGSRSGEVEGTRLQRDVAYAGLILRYSILTGSPVYASLGTLVGGGAVVLGRRDSYDSYDDDFDADDFPHASDGFFAVEPQLSVHVNLTRWMRVGIQGGYRFTSGLGQGGYTQDDLNGPTLGGTLQFGYL